MCRFSVSCKAALVWLIDWLIVRLIHWLIEWVIDRSIDWLIDWLVSSYQHVVLWFRLTTGCFCGEGWKVKPHWTWDVREFVRIFGRACPREGENRRQSAWETRGCGKTPAGNSSGGAKFERLLLQKQPANVVRLFLSRITPIIIHHCNNVNCFRFFLSRNIVVSLDVHEAGALELTYSYMAYGAYWNPKYGNLCRSSPKKGNLFIFHGAFPVFLRRCARFAGEQKTNGKYSEQINFLLQRKSINQSINQEINKAPKQSINQSIKQSRN